MEWCFNDDGGGGFLRYMTDWWILRRNQFENGKMRLHNIPWTWWCLYKTATLPPHHFGLESMHIRLHAHWIPLLGIFSGKPSVSLCASLPVPVSLCVCVCVNAFCLLPLLSPINKHHKMARLRLICFSYWRNHP